MASRAKEIAVFDVSRDYALAEMCKVSVEDARSNDDALLPASASNSLSRTINFVSRFLPGEIESFSAYVDKSVAAMRLCKCR